MSNLANRECVPCQGGRILAAKFDRAATSA